jgi:hypothetical protein
MERTMNQTTTLEADDVVQPAGPTFKIFTGMLKTYEKGDGDGRKYLSCTASSTVEDLHGDRMTEECVMGMAPQAKSKGMTIFLNHSYKFPEDVFGKTTDAKIISRANDANGKAVYDLDLEIVLNEANPRALETYASIKDQGMKAGVSIGAMIEDWDFIDEEAGFWGGLEIKQVDLLEASIVGIPANQRSWGVNGIKSLGAPKEIISKALGKSAPEPTLSIGLPATTNTFTTTALEITMAGCPDCGQSKGEGDSCTNKFHKNAEPEVENSTAPEEETPAEDVPETEPDPEAENGVATLEDAEIALDSLKTAGASGILLDTVMGFLEGATEEVVSLRKALDEVTQERDELRKEILAAAEIVETIARTPIGRKTQFTGPVTAFRARFGGMYDEDFLKALEGDNDE